jgi:two-component system phosphate regulon sensor histidine kinase PhoR
MREGIIVSALAIGLIALAFGFILTNQFTRPLVHMTDVASQMAEGDYEQRLPRLGKGEIGELSRALNQLATSSAERISTIGEERNQLAAILSGLVEGVIAIDRYQRIIHVNGAAVRMLGVKQDEIIEKLLWEAFRIGELIQAADRVLGGEEFVQTQFRRDELSVELTAVPLKDTSDNISGAIVVLNDVTEIRRFETMRNDFVANASHELKTPISAIRGLIETVIDDADMSQEDRDRFADRIKRQTIRLGSIVGDLLTLSEFDSPLSEFEMHLIDMVEVVNGETANSVQIARDKDIVFQSVGMAKSVVVNGDEKALMQLVGNLIDNALKYTSVSGQVKVELEADESWAYFSVADTGIGIPEDEQSRVFERFYRVDKARSTELGGTGLGLSIVRDIALAHGGDVSVTSSLGSGSVFRVKLPLAGLV